MLRNMYGSSDRCKSQSVAILSQGVNIVTTSGRKQLQEELSRRVQTDNSKVKLVEQQVSCEDATVDSL
eukprot:5144680-Amphidinium_carterae.1